MEECPCEDRGEEDGDGSYKEGGEDCEEEGYGKEMPAEVVAAKCVYPREEVEGGWECHVKHN